MIGLDAAGAGCDYQHVRAPTHSIENASTTRNLQKDPELTPAVTDATRATMTPAVNPCFTLPAMSNNSLPHVGYPLPHTS